MLQFILILFVTAYLFSRNFEIRDKTGRARKQFGIFSLFIMVALTVWAVQKFLWKYVIFAVISFLVWPLIKKWVKDYLGYDLGGNRSESTGVAEMIDPASRP